MATAQTKVAQSTVTDNSVLRALEPGIRAGLLQIGDRAVAELLSALSVPVEYVGSQVIRSDPGEPPRMEEDALRQSTDANLIPGDPLPSLRVSVGPRPGGDPDAATVLEFGGVSSWGQIAARPFMRPQMLRIEGYAEDEIGDGLKRTLTK
jgi:hypothetical protein